MIPSCRFFCKRLVLSQNINIEPEKSKTNFSAEPENISQEHPPNIPEYAIARLTSVSFSIQSAVVDQRVRRSPLYIRYNTMQTHVCNLLTQTCGSSSFQSQQIRTQPCNMWSSHRRALVHRDTPIRSQTGNVHTWCEDVNTRPVVRPVGHGVVY